MKIQKFVHIVMVASFLLTLVAPGQAQAREDEIDRASALTVLPAQQKVVPQVSLGEGIDLESLDPKADFILIFNQPMEASSEAETLLTYPYIAGRLNWDETGTILTLTPDEGFTPGKSVTFFLDPDLQTADGQRFEQVQYWQAQVRKGPGVTFRGPNVETLNTRFPTIQIGFDRPMDQESVATAFTILPPVAFSIQWIDEIMSISFDQALTPGQRYNFMLSTEATDLEGIPLDEEYQFDYWLNALSVKVLEPTVGLNQVRLGFNYDIDPVATGTPFEITPAVEAVWKWTTSKGGFFTITGELAYGTQYTVSVISDLLDTYGNPIPAPSAPITFSAPPPIIAVTPKDGAEGIDDISITFSTPMDQASTQAAFSLNPSAEGSFEWEGNTLHYRLSKSLAPWREYTVELGTDARDTSRKPILVTPYTWTFYAGFDYNEYGSATTFASYGPNVQEIDAAGRRVVHFRASPTETSLHFSLYPLELGQLAQKYSAEYGIFYYNGAPEIDTEGFDAAYTWEASYPEGGFQEAVIPEDVPPGAYILEMSYGSQVRSQLFVSVTNHKIVAKLAGDELFVWVTDFQGLGIADLEVRLYSDRGEKIRVGETDNNGIYRTTVPEGYTPMLVGTLGEDGDVAFSGLAGYFWESESGDQKTADGSDDWEWYSSWYRRNYQSSFTVYTYTDRPIYRPGQTVYFKSIIRVDHDARYMLPVVGTPVTIRLKDGRDNLLQTFEMTTNDFGSVNGEFGLIEEAMLGAYTIEIEIDGETHSQIFKVQDYRKSDIEINVTTDAAKYIPGDTVFVEIDANYLLGEPLSNAKIKIQRYALWRDYWGDEEYTWIPQGGSVQKTTDADGHFTYTIAATTLNDYYERVSWRSSLEVSRWAFEVTVDDGSNQGNSASTIFAVYNSGEQLSLEVEGGYLHAFGEPITLQVKCSTIFGEPVKERKVFITTIWHSRINNKDRNLGPIVVTTDSNGVATTTITPEAVGYYEFELSGSGVGGSQISYSTWIFVYGDKDSWAKDYEHKITISTDKQNYQPYDTAKLFIGSSLSGPALLTFERNSVIHYKQIELTAPLTVLDVEIIPEYAPNVFISVSIWEAQDTHLTIPKDRYEWTTTIADSSLRRATAEVLVEPLGKELAIEITPDKGDYTPRDEATFTIRVTDSQDKPVSAEISLALVDEAIFNLSEDLSGPIFEAFYHRRRYGVSTYDSLSPIRYLYYDEGGRGGGDGGVLPFSPRQDFPDTAAWYPALKTDRNGEVRITLTLPDNLTSWRVMVKAATASTKVGEAFINIETKQDIVIRPVLPAALTAGDEAELGALVYNYSEIEQQVTVDLQLSDYLLTNENSQQAFSLKPDEMRMLTWAVSAQNAGEAEVTITASVENVVGDAILVPINIRPLSIPDVYTQAGEFTGDMAATLVRPVNTLEQSNVEIRLSRSIAGTVLEGLAYLTGYPYGCVEQTMSKALPNAVVGRALNRLGVYDPTLEAKLPGLISMGLQKLYGMQHRDGGWGWWHDDATNDYQTAWVVFGLALTAEAGYEVSPSVVENGAEWLRSHLDEMDVKTRAYALYSLALAGYGDLPAMQSLAVEAYQLDTFSQAALALSLHKLGDEEAAQRMLGLLAQSSKQKDTAKGTLVYWPQSGHDGEYSRKTMASTTRSTALVLDAFAQIDPENELIPGIVRYLMQNRKLEGWGSTNETTFAVLALTDHLLSLRTDAMEISYTIGLNGKEISAGSFPSEKPTFSLVVPAEELEVGVNLLNINQDSENPMYYTLVSKMYLAQSEIPASGVVQIKRTYTPVGEQDGIQAGDLVRVKLEIIIAKGASFLIIEDMLPGGLEALNENLNSTTHVADFDFCDECYDPYYGFHWQDYGYNQKEVHPDRVTFFITEFKPGKVLITYMARATHAGVFVSMPTEVYAMYDSTVWGRSSSSPITIEK